MKFPVEFFWVLAAVAGGVARYLNGYVNGHKFNLPTFIASAFVAGFSGVMFALWGDTMDLPAQVIHMMAGVGGFFGEQTMKFILERIAKKY